jgi:hypothetical protein
MTLKTGSATRRRRRRRRSSHGLTWFDVLFDVLDNDIEDRFYNKKKLKKKQSWLNAV